MGAGARVVFLESGAQVVGRLELEGDHAGLDSLGLRVQKVVELLVDSLQPACDVILVLVRVLKEALTGPLVLGEELQSVHVALSDDLGVPALRWLEVSSVQHPRGLEEWLVALLLFENMV